MIRIILLLTAVLWINIGLAQTYDEVIESDYGTSIVKQGDLYGVIDDEKDLIIPVEFIKIVVDPYGFVVTKTNGKKQFWTEGGRQIDGVSEFDQTWGIVENRRIVKITDRLDIEKYGYLNEVGDRVTAFVYHDAFDFNNGWASVEKFGKKGAINTSGEQIVPCGYKEIYLTEIGFKAILPNGKMKIWNWDGDLVNLAEFDRIYNLHDDRAVFQLGSKFGYLDADGKITIEAIYDDAWDFGEGYGRVLLDGRKGTIDKSGNVVWDKTTDNAANAPIVKKSDAYVARTGTVGISISESNTTYKKSNSIYTAEKMIAHGSSVYVVGQDFTASNKPGVVVKYDGLTGTATNLQQAKELISESVTTYGSNLKFRDVYVSENSIVAGGDHSIVVFDESSMEVQKELSVDDLIISKIASGGDGICVALAVKEFKNFFDGLQKDERREDAQGLHVIVWNYKTNEIVEKQLVASEIWRHFGIMSLENNTVAISYSAMALNREGVNALYPKHTGNANFISIINPKESLSNGTLKISKSLVLKDSQGYQFEDFIMDRKGYFAIAMINGHSVGVVKVDPNLENYITYAHNLFPEKKNPRYFEYQGEYLGSYEPDNAYSRVYILEDPQSDGYILNHRLTSNTNSDLISEDRDKLFMSQPYYLYVNSENLDMDSWDFVNVSNDPMHQSNHSSCAQFRDFSSFKSSLYHQQSGFYIMLEEFRDQKRELNERYGHNVEVSLNLWLVRPEFER
ncbi:MAG: hypothetical protein Crog4KO_34010 [Crocinitomicaceae bacterium]